MFYVVTLLVSSRTCLCHLTENLLLQPFGVLIWLTLFAKLHPHLPVSAVTVHSLPQHHKEHMRVYMHMVPFPHVKQLSSGYLAGNNTLPQQALGRCNVDKSLMLGTVFFHCQHVDQEQVL